MARITLGSDPVGPPGDGVSVTQAYRLASYLANPTAPTGTPAAPGGPWVLTPPEPTGTSIIWASVHNGSTWSTPRPWSGVVARAPRITGGAEDDRPEAGDGDPPISEDLYFNTDDNTIEQYFVRGTILGWGVIATITGDDAIVAFASAPQTSVPGPEGLQAPSGTDVNPGQVILNGRPAGNWSRIPPTGVEAPNVIWASVYVNDAWQLPVQWSGGVGPVGPASVIRIFRASYTMPATPPDQASADDDSIPTGWSSSQPHIQSGGPDVWYSERGNTEVSWSTPVRVGSAVVDILIYQAAYTQPPTPADQSAPSDTSIPDGWSTIQPAIATGGPDVWQSSRRSNEVTWTAPIRVAASIGRTLYRTGYTKPATPTGAAPANWSSLQPDIAPGGPDVWCSTQIGETTWSDPVRVAQSTERRIYRQAATKPATPTGANPSGWSDTQPDIGAISNPVWASTQTGATTWSEPVRVAVPGTSLGEVYQRAATPPGIPSGNTLPPTGWSTAPPSPTRTEAVYVATYTVFPGGAVTWHGVAEYTSRVEYGQVYQRAATPPGIPSGNTIPPTGWSAAAPNPTQTEAVYVATYTVVAGGGVTWHGVAQWAKAGVEGTSHGEVYRRAATPPGVPTGNTLPPDGWSTAPLSPTRTEAVYVATYTVHPGGAVTWHGVAEHASRVEYGQVYMRAATPPGIPSGNTLPPQGWSTAPPDPTQTEAVYVATFTVVAGGGVTWHGVAQWAKAGVPGTSKGQVFQRAATPPGLPSGNVIPPQGWSVAPPDPTETEATYAATYTVAPGGAVTWDGVALWARFGGSGPVGDSSGQVYQRAATPPGTPRGNTLPPPGWSRAAPNPTVTEAVYAATYTLAAGGAVTWHGVSEWSRRAADGQTVTGPAGPAGPPGPKVTGPAGPAGPPGPKVTGPAGPAGPPGPKVTGPAGPAGPPGPKVTGPKGPAGPPGPKVTGPAGPAGPPGPKVTGPKGPAGPPGPKVTGPAGPAGPPGPKVTGPKGPAGPPGPKVTGPKGPAGPPGPKVTGPAGPAGPPGPKVTGPAGPAGPPGPKVTGPAGPAGPSGSPAGRHNHSGSVVVPGGGTNSVSIGFSGPHSH